MRATSSRNVTFALPSLSPKVSRLPVPVLNFRIISRPINTETVLRLLLIGLGGGVGSILRYLLSGLVQSGEGGSAFPAGTLAVNVLGCLAIGVLTELSEARGYFDADTRAMLMVGLIGGFTTFSTFANETVSAMRDNALLIAAGNALLSVGLGLLAVWGGRAFAHAIWG